MNKPFRYISVFSAALIFSIYAFKAYAIQAQYTCQVGYTGIAGSLSANTTCWISGYSGGLSGGSSSPTDPFEPPGGGGAGGGSYSPPTESYCAGNPILISSGKKFQHTQDLQGKNSFASIERYYSQSRSQKSLIGSKWAMGFEYSLEFIFNEDGEVQRATLHRPDDKNIILLYNEEDNSWHYTNGVFANFVFAEDSEIWIYQNSQGETENYNSEGKIVSRTDLHKQGVFYIYENDNLVNIESTHGDKLVIKYNDKDLISRIYLNEKEFLYSYTNDDLLEKIKFPNNTEYSFKYEDERHPGALTQKNIDGVLYARWEYNSDGKGILSEHFNGSDRTEFSYNANSTSVTNPLGKVSTFHFDTINGKRLPTKVDSEEKGSCIASNKTYTYDQFGNRDLVTDWSGNTTDYDYNYRGLMIRKIEGLGTAEERTTKLEWHSTLPLLLKKITQETSTEFTYDDNNRVVSKKIISRSTGEIRRWEFEYILYGNRAIKKIRENGPADGNSDITVKTFGKSGNLLKTVNALGHTKVYGDYNALGQPRYALDINGRKTKFEYDEVGNLVKKIDLSDAKSVTSYKYNALGQVVEKESDINGKTTYTYDRAYRKISKTNSLGESLNLTLDEAGNVTKKVISADSSPWHFKKCGNEYIRNNCNSTKMQITETLYPNSLTKAFDALSRVTKVLQGGEALAHYYYDVNNNIYKAVDGNGNATFYEYDSLNRKISETNSNNETIYYKYNNLNLVTEIIDDRGNQTIYDYNDFGELIKIDSPDSGISSFVYNKAGQKEALIRADGTTLTFKYDDLGRIVSTSVDGKKIKRYGYDFCKNGLSKLCYISDSSGRTEYKYSKNGKVNVKTVGVDNNRYQVKYDYYKAGHLKSVKYPSGIKLKYFYNKIGKVIDIKVKNISLVSDIAYKPMGPIKEWKFGNGQKRVIQYDNQQNIKRILSSDVQDLRYKYDFAGNITSKQNFTYNYLYNYDYDIANRLTGVIGSNLHKFEYDSLGNRVLKGGIEAEEKYNIASNSNRLLSVDIGSKVRRFRYDKNGNVIYDEKPGLTKKYTYNAENRLVTATVNGNTTEYSYNAHGKRVSKTTNNGTKYHYIYSESGQLIAEAKDGIIIKEYLYLEGKLLGLFQDKKLFFVHTDHLGRPEIVTDMSKSTVWRAKNQAFGRKVLLDHIDGLNLGFPGQYWDEEKSSWYNGFRDYDSTIGRYLQSDPIGVNGGLNTYNYVLGNPISLIDSLGLLPKDPLPPETNVPNECESIYLLAKNSLERAGLLSNEDIKFDSHFAVVQYDSDNKPILSTLKRFDTEFQAQEYFASHYDDNYKQVPGLINYNTKEITIYAQATMPFDGFIGGKRYEWSAETFTKFTIMHELGHLYGKKQEFQAHNYALDKLGL